jgi:hypothetical protein
LPPRRRDLNLSVKEFGVLEALLGAPPAYLSAEELLQRVWDENADPFTKTVQVTIGRLRRKVGPPAVIHTAPASAVGLLLGAGRARQTGSWNQPSRLSTLSRLLIPRILTTSSVVGVATAFRVGAGCLGLLAQRTPPLVGLAVRASVGGQRTATAQATFREEFVALARQSAEISWREVRRGVHDLDASTRPDDHDDGRPVRRPYRVKP